MSFHSSSYLPTSLLHTLTCLSYQSLIFSLCLSSCQPLSPSSQPHFLLLFYFAFVYIPKLACFSLSLISVSFLFAYIPFFSEILQFYSVSSSCHLRLILHSLSYLISGWVFSRFSGDELFSLKWIRPEPLILLEQWNTDSSPVLTLHFMVDWFSVMEALEEEY